MQSWDCKHKLSFHIHATKTKGFLQSQIRPVYNENPQKKKKERLAKARAARLPARSAGGGANIDLGQVQKLIKTD